VVLVDTSVLIDFFKGKKNTGTEKLKTLIVQNVPFGITFHIYQEILQGAKTEKEFKSLKKYLETQTFYEPKVPRITYENAAKIYFDLRKRGLTVRSTIDCLIAQIAIENNLYLLESDKDFNTIAKVVEFIFY